MKLEAKELRIGNWIKHTPSPIGNQEFIISDIRTHGELTVNGIDINDCEPIELTEEWLLKFGFEKGTFIKQTNSQFWSKGEHEIFEYKEVNIFKYDMLIISEGIIIKTVNQLQNLYFALAGEELTINKNKDEKEINKKT